MVAFAKDYSSATLPVAVDVFGKREDTVSANSPQSSSRDSSPVQIPPAAQGLRQNFVIGAVAENISPAAFKPYDGPTLSAGREKPRIEQITDGLMTAHDKIQAAQELYKLLNPTGASVDRDKVFEKLQQYKPEQLAEIRDAYGKLYPRDATPGIVHRDNNGITWTVTNLGNYIPRSLVSEVKEKTAQGLIQNIVPKALGGNPEDLNAAVDLIFAGKTEAATAYRLKYENQGVTGNQRLVTILKDYKGDPAELERQYARVAKEPLDSRLQYELGKDSVDYKIARTYLNPDKIAQAKDRIEIYAGYSGVPVNYPKLEAELRDISPEARKTIVAAINKEQTIPFAEKIKPQNERILTEDCGYVEVKPSRDASQHTENIGELVSNNPAYEKAVKLDNLLNNQGNYSVAPFHAIFAQTTAEERKQICDQYAQLKYAQLKHAKPNVDGEKFLIQQLKSSASSDNFDKLESIVKDGEMS